MDSTPPNWSGEPHVHLHLQGHVAGPVAVLEVWQVLARRLGASGRPGVRLRECVVVNGAPSTVVVA